MDKLDDYAAFGVRWYWIVDPQCRTLEVFERAADGAYACVRRESAGMLADLPRCEGLTIDLDALWSELDDLEPSDDAE